MIDYRIGDVRAVMSTIPDGSVSLVASSPPFIALRSYLPDDHPDKALEIGSEPDPATFLDTLLALTAEWGRVLAPWGSIAIELGDTFAGGNGWTIADEKSPWRDTADLTVRGRKPAGGGWPRAKSLALIPQLYATSLAYGRNLLTGQPSPAGQWLVRNVIVWHRPNPAVGALGDKVRPSTSYITVATRSAKRWFDLDAVRTAVQHPNQIATRNGKTATTDPLVSGRGLKDYNSSQTAGAPPLDCWFDHHDTWTLTTQPSSLAHYAMWPAKLAERLILMMCPAEVCAVCGEGRRRLTHVAYEATTVRRVESKASQSVVTGVSSGHHAHQATNPIATRGTLGWSDCGHGNYVPGVVLDPFAGTGTTLAVADLHHRDAIGVDLDSRNRDLYLQRRDECARALFDVRPQMTGQLDMFGEATP